MKVLTVPSSQKIRSEKGRLHNVWRGTHDLGTVSFQYQPSIRTINTLQGKMILLEHIGSRFECNLYFSRMVEQSTPDILIKVVKIGLRTHKNRNQARKQANHRTGS